MATARVGCNRRALATSSGARYTDGPMTSRRSFLATLAAALATPVSARPAVKMECGTLAEVFETIALRAAERLNPARFAKMATPAVNEAIDRECAEQTRVMLRAAGHSEMADWLDRFYEEGAFAKDGNA